MTAQQLDVINVVDDDGPAVILRNPVFSYRVEYCPEGEQPFWRPDPLVGLPFSQLEEALQALSYARRAHTQFLSTHPGGRVNFYRLTSSVRSDWQEVEEA
jgi:hypothetical protein